MWLKLALIPAFSPKKPTNFGTSRAVQSNCNLIGDSVWSSCWQIQVPLGEKRFW